MFVDRTSIKNLVFIRLNPGDDILASLEEAAKQNRVKNAVILCGFGSVNVHHYHVVASRVNPPQNIFVKEDKASDIVNINGFVVDGRIHAHIVHSDTEKAFGGHLEPGVRVLTFCVIALAEVDEDFTDWDSIGKIEDFQKKA